MTKACLNCLPTLTFGLKAIYLYFTNIVSRPNSLESMSNVRDTSKGVKLKKWAIPGLFFFIFVFSIQLTVNVRYKFLPMTGFEPRTSGIGSDCSTN